MVLGEVPAEQEEGASELWCGCNKDLSPGAATAHSVMCLCLIAMPALQGWMFSLVFLETAVPACCSGLGVPVYQEEPWAAMGVTGGTPVALARHT